LKAVHRSACLLALMLLISFGCSSERRYPLSGQVLAVDAPRHQITVKHGDIHGFMPGMTMPFTVKDSRQLSAVKAGDLIEATLIVEESTGYLDDVRKTGEAPLPAGGTPAPPRSLIEPGTVVPDVEFTDQEGRPRRFSDWRGRTVAVTFVYTRCPVPDFCPLMDRHFAAAQKVLAADEALAARVHLVSVTFDPDHDTPAVLREHAARISADPAIWSYVTGPAAAIDRFAGAFGVTIMRGDKPIGEIVHNLRTAVIAADGRLVRVLNGNEWTPEQLVDAIREADARR
jgi:protein SCO1/2